MMQFTVPQFIDVEPKIIGPVTGRQFVIMLTYFIFAAILYRLLVITYFAAIALPTFVMSVFFAFVKINGRPSYYVILNFIQTIKKPKIRTWNHKLDFYEFINDGLDDLIKEGYDKKEAPSASKLSELSLIVDTMGAYKGEDDQLKIKYKQSNGPKEE
jgi:hypothetical protein